MAEYEYGGVSSQQQTFEQDGETVHAVILRHASGIRWNAFFWGAGLKFCNSFARRQNAEKWLQRLLERYFPALQTGNIFCSPESGPGRPGSRASQRTNQAK